MSFVDRHERKKRSRRQNSKRKELSGRLRCKRKELSERCKSKRGKHHLVQVRSVAREHVSTREPGTGSNVAVVKCGFIVFVWRFPGN